MKTTEQQARFFQRAVLMLIALATVGWMAGSGLGVAVAASDSASFVRNTPAWLNPALQGVVALALLAVVSALLAIVRRIRIRAAVMSETLPHLFSHSC